VPFRTL